MESWPSVRLCLHCLWNHTEGRTASYPTLYPLPLFEQGVCRSLLRTGCSCVQYNCTCAVMLFNKIQLPITECRITSDMKLHSGTSIGNWYPWMRGGWSVSKLKQINLWIAENTPDQIFIPSSHLFLPTLYPMFHTICPVLYMYLWHTSQCVNC